MESQNVTITANGEDKTCRQSNTYSPLTSSIQYKESNEMEVDKIEWCSIEELKLPEINLNHYKSSQD